MTRPLAQHSHLWPQRQVRGAASGVLTWGDPASPPGAAWIPAPGRVAVGQCCGGFPEPALEKLACLPLFPAPSGNLVVQAGVAGGLAEERQLPCVQLGVSLVGSCSTFRLLNVLPRAVVKPLLLPLPKALFSRDLGLSPGELSSSRLQPVVGQLSGRLRWTVPRPC